MFVKGDDGVSKISPLASSRGGLHCHFVPREKLLEAFYSRNQLFCIKMCLNLELSPHFLAYFSQLYCCQKFLKYLR